MFLPSWPNQLLLSWKLQKLVSPLPDFCRILFQQQKVEQFSAQTNWNWKVQEWRSKSQIILNLKRQRAVHQWLPSHWPFFGGPRPIRVNSGIYLIFVAPCVFVSPKVWLILLMNCTNVWPWHVATYCSGLVCRYQHQEDSPLTIIPFLYNFVDYKLRILMLGLIRYDKEFRLS